MGEWHHPPHYTESARRFSEEARAREIALFVEMCLPRLREAARGYGYALAVHGTQRRDLDLIACPWIDKAVEPEVLRDRICAVVKDCTGWGHNSDRDKGWTQKPHGRVAVTIIAGADVHLDLSIMPRLAAEAENPPG